MPRVITVAKARKAPGRCIRCAKPIEVAESYRSIAFRYGGKRFIHVGCGSFRSSEMTQNDKLSALYAAQEDLGANLDSEFTELADVEAMIEDACASIREVVSMYEEMADDIESGFGHETEQSTTARDNAEQVDTYASELEGLSFVDFEDYHRDHCERPLHEHNEEERAVNGEAAACPDHGQLLEDWRGEIREDVGGIDVGL